MICGAIRPPNDHDNDLGDQKISRNLFEKCLGRDRIHPDELYVRNLKHGTLAFHDFLFKKMRKNSQNCRGEVK